MVEWLLKYWLQVIFTTLSGVIIATYKKERKERKALILGVQAILRDRLIQGYNYYSPKGCLSFHDRANLYNIYQQYHALGANGVIDDLMEELFELPYK